VPGRGIALPEQLWIDVNGSGQTPQETVEIPVLDDPNKLPMGGLWTSTYSEGSSEYVRRILLVLDGFIPLEARAAWLLTPEVANVLEVVDRSSEDEFAGLAPEAPYWPRVAEHLDAVHMTAAGALAFPCTPAPGDLPQAGLITAFAKRIAGRGPLDFWEAERTIWFRWRFSQARHIGDIQFPML
jgi:hypothetical protein